MLLSHCLFCYLWHCTDSQRCHKWSKNYLDTWLFRCHRDSHLFTQMNVKCFATIERQNVDFFFFRSISPPQQTFPSLTIGCNLQRSKFIIDTFLLANIPARAGKLKKVIWRKKWNMRKATSMKNRPITSNKFKWVWCNVCMSMTQILNASRVEWRCTGRSSICWN